MKYKLSSKITWAGFEKNDRSQESLVYQRPKKHLTLG